MKSSSHRLTPVLALTTLFVFFLSGTMLIADAQKPELFKLDKLFPTASQDSVYFDESIIANPLLDFSSGQALLIVPTANGLITALDSETGASVWAVKLPCLATETIELVSTPVAVGSKLVVLYQLRTQKNGRSYHMAVIDLSEKQLDMHFPVLDIRAEQAAADGRGVVKFNNATAFAHAALKYLPRADAEFGYVYASFGSAGDIQPFHGWMFEIDVQAWLNQGAKNAIRSVLLTTPEAECPVTMPYGTQEMICGGGIWTPAGPQIYTDTGQAEILIPTGNGQVDINRHDFANTLMRVRPGLAFDPDCDANLCADFNPSQPAEACISSCKNLFIPRLAVGNKPLKPASGECDDKSFWDCLAWMDYDFGASSPVKVKLPKGQSVLVQPGKDGGVYLLDAVHLGTQYDRMEIVETCGTRTDPCKAGWMGMIVTQPVVTYFDNEAVIIIATFSPDKSHPAGLVALKIVENNGKPKFKRFWQYPNPKQADSLNTFRSHSSFLALSTPGKSKQPVVWVVDINTQGTLYGIRVKDGRLVAKQSLQGAGRPLSAPVIYGNRIYITSSMPDTGKAMLEAYQINIAD